MTPETSPFSSRIGLFKVLTQVSPPGLVHFSTRSSGSGSHHRSIVVAVLIGELARVKVVIVLAEDFVGPQSQGDGVALVAGQVLRFPVLDEDHLGQALRQGPVPALVGGQVGRALADRSFEDHEKGQGEEEEEGDRPQPDEQIGDDAVGRRLIVDAQPLPVDGLVPSILLEDLESFVELEGELLVALRDGEAIPHRVYFAGDGPQVLELELALEVIAQIQGQDGGVVAARCEQDQAVRVVAHEDEIHGGRLRGQAIGHHGALLDHDGLALEGRERGDGRVVPDPNRVGHGGYGNRKSEVRPSLGRIRHRRRHVEPAGRQIVSHATPDIRADHGFVAERPRRFLDEIDPKTEHLSVFHERIGRIASADAYPENSRARAPRGCPLFRGGAEIREENGIKART